MASFIKGALARHMGKLLEIMIGLGWMIKNWQIQYGSLVLAGYSLTLRLEEKLLSGSIQISDCTGRVDTLLDTTLLFSLWNPLDIRQENANALAHFSFQYKQTCSNHFTRCSHIVRKDTYASFLGELCCVVRKQVKWIACNLIKMTHFDPVSPFLNQPADRHWELISRHEVIRVSGIKLVSALDDI